MAKCNQAGARQMQKKVNKSDALFDKCARTGKQKYCRQGTKLANQVRAWLQKCGL